MVEPVAFMLTHLPFRPEKTSTVLPRTGMDCEAVAATVLAVENSMYVRTDPALTTRADLAGVPSVFSGLKFARTAPVAVSANFCVAALRGLNGTTYTGWTMGVVLDWLG